MKGKVLKILKYMGVGFIVLIIIGIVFGKPMADEIIINEEISQWISTKVNK